MIQMGAVVRAVIDQRYGTTDRNERMAVSSDRICRKPEVLDVDGPAGLNGLINGTKGNQYTSAVVVAQHGIQSYRKHSVRLWVMKRMRTKYLEFMVRL